MKCVLKLPKKLLTELKGMSNIFKILQEKVKLQDKLLKEFLNKIVDKYREVTITLIGSRTRNNYLPSSDFDLIIILPNKYDIENEQVNVYMIKPLSLKCDVIVINVDELFNSKIIGSMIYGCKILIDNLGLKNYLIEKFRCTCENNLK